VSLAQRNGRARGRGRGQRRGRRGPRHAGAPAPGEHRAQRGDGPRHRRAIAQISQGRNGEVRVRLHDKHAALVSIGRHLGMFTDSVKVKAVYGISEEPMSAEEWKKQFVKGG
jgi:hypothetical protein